MPKVYDLGLNPHTATIAIWCRPNFEGDDGATHYILNSEYDSDNGIKLYKNASDNLILSHEGSGTGVTASYDISAWNAGEWHSIIAVWSKNTIDGTDYLHLYIDGSEVANSTTKLGLVQGVEQYWDMGHDGGASQFDGLFSMQIDDIPWYATESAATTAGFNKCKSAEYFHNSGAGNVPVVDEHTKFMLVNDNEG